MPPPLDTLRAVTRISGAARPGTQVDDDLRAATAQWRIAEVLWTHSFLLSCTGDGICVAFTSPEYVIDAAVALK